MVNEPSPRTRRNFLRSALAGTVGALALAACAPTASPTPAPTTAANPPAPTAAPAKAAPTVAPTVAPTTAAKPAEAAKPAAKTVDLQQLVEAAKREGRLNYYSSINPATGQAFGRAFTEKYGIEVNVLRLASGALAQRYTAEAEASNVVADVVQLADPIFFDDAVKKGWIAPIEGLPALAEWPKEFWNGYYAKVAISPQNVIYNTNLVKPEEVPKQWTDLLDPRWKGQILLTDPRQVPAVLVWCYDMRELYGDDFLKQLGQQEFRLITSGVAGVQQLAAGAAQLLFPSSHGSVVSLEAENAPVKDVILEPASGNENLGGVSANAPNPNGARLLFNFLLTKEGQAIQAEDGYSSVLPDVPGAPPLPKTYRSPRLREAVAQQAELVALLGLN